MVSAGMLLAAWQLQQLGGDQCSILWQCCWRCRAHPVRSHACALSLRLTPVLCCAVLCAANGVQVWATYSPVKNSPDDARAKAAEGNPTHSATTGNQSNVAALWPLMPHALCLSQSTDQTSH